MGIDVPELDDREYEAILEEAKKLIPAYAEEWTDFNPHDPGITILEALAWLTETYVYQVDQVTDAHREKYLNLMGERPRPPEPATVTLAIEAVDGSAGTAIPARKQLLVSDGSETKKIFETAEELVLTEADVTAVITESGSGRTDNSHANETEEMFYRAFGDRAPEGAATYVGFDDDPFRNADRTSIAVEYHDDDLPDPAEHGEEESTFEPSVELAWEYCTDYERWESDEAWDSMSVLEDGTDRFYHGGRVTLARPAGWDPETYGFGRTRVAGRPPGVVWIRCRVTNPGYEIPPGFDAIRTNVVEVSHRARVEVERLDPVHTETDPRSLTDQRYAFEYAPVIDAAIHVGGREWTEVEDFDGTGPNEECYVLDRSEGVVSFGDGQNGAYPDPDETVLATAYEVGGGEEGNVPSSSTWQFLDAELSVADGVPLTTLGVSSIGPATGGRDRETIEAAFRRVRRDLRHPYRAVTRADHESVAVHTPGLRFGRATTVVDHQGGPEDVADSPEVVVVVVPYAPPDHAKPEPSEGFLAAVREHLDRHRLLTDRISVEPPTYVGLEVDVVARVDRSTPRPEWEADLADSIRSFVDPVHGYDGEGWPFGRPLYREELVDVLGAVEWVETVRNVSVSAHGDATVDSNGNVLIDDASLLYVQAVHATFQTRGTQSAIGGD